MTEQIDSRTGATLAIHLYGTAYGPASQYFTHVSGSALLRRVTADYRYSTKPVNSWARRGAGSADRRLRRTAGWGSREPDCGTGGAVRPARRGPRPAGTSAVAGHYR